MNKIIFLDIDGVMNSETSFKRRKKIVDMGNMDIYEVDFPCQPMVDNLNYIIEKTGAKIVISSTWRLIHPLRIKDEEIFAIGRIYKHLSIEKIFNMQGIKGEIIGITPTVKMDRVRGKEINSWLKDRKGSISNYVILDDDSDMLPHQLPFFVQTTWKDGLTKEHAEKAIEILNHH